MSSTEAPDQVDLAEVDVLDPTWFVDGPPHELFARMRAEAPVRWNQLPDGGGCLVADPSRRRHGRSARTPTRSRRTAAVSSSTPTR